jgi:hypothetical protein
LTRGWRAATGHEQHAHATRERRDQGRPGARRDALVSPQQRAVDVEREELKRAYFPSQISTLSIVSPG